MQEPARTRFAAGVRWWSGSCHTSARVRSGSRSQCGRGSGSSSWCTRWQGQGWISWRSWPPRLASRLPRWRHSRTGSCAGRRCRCWSCGRARTAAGEWSPRWTSSPTTTSWPQRSSRTGSRWHDTDGGQQHEGDVGREEESEELQDVVVDAAAFLDGGGDGGEDVVQQHQVGDLAADIAAALASVDRYRLAGEDRLVDLEGVLAREGPVGRDAIAASTRTTSPGTSRAASSSTRWWSRMTRAWGAASSRRRASASSARYSCQTPWRC